MKWIPLVVGLAIAGSVLVAMHVLDEPTPIIVEVSRPAPEPVFQPPAPARVVAVVPPAPPPAPVPVAAPPSQVEVVRHQPSEQIAATVQNAFPSSQELAERTKPDATLGLPDRWRNRSADQAVNMMKRRLERIQKDIASAEARGDTEAAEKARASYERNEARLKTVEARRETAPSTTPGGEVTQ